MSTLTSALRKPSGHATLGLLVESMKLHGTTILCSMLVLGDVWPDLNLQRSYIGLYKLWSRAPGLTKYSPCDAYQCSTCA